MLLGRFVEKNYYHRTSLAEWNPLTTRQPFYHRIMEKQQLSLSIFIIQQSSLISLKSKD